MIKIVRTDSENADFIELVKYLDEDLAVRDGQDHSFYDQFNKIDKIKYAVVVYKNEKPSGPIAWSVSSPTNIKKWLVRTPTMGLVHQQRHRNSLKQKFRYCV